MVQIVLASELLLLSSCSKPEEDKEAECTPILQEILEKQKIREIARKDFEITIDYYTQGKISMHRWEEEKNNWLSLENELLREVNKLYDHSYRIKCLN